MNRSEETEYLWENIKPVLLASQNVLNDFTISIGLEQPVSVKRDFWLSGTCIAFDSDTVFKPSVGSHYLCACSSSTPLSILLNRQHGSPPNTFISSIPVYWISILSLLPSYPLSLFLLFFQGIPLRKKIIFLSQYHVLNLLVQASLLSPGVGGWREEGGIFTKAHLIVKRFLSTGCNTLRNVEK